MQRRGVHPEMRAVYVKCKGSYNPIEEFLTDSGCRDRALLVLGSNTAKQAALRHFPGVIFFGGEAVKKCC
jgi:hypothetical protein